MRRIWAGCGPRWGNDPSSVTPPLPPEEAGGYEAVVMTSPVPPIVILDRPQMGENIGAAARVMANFGLETLRLVSPRDGWPQERAWATASGADWVLEGVEVFDSVAAAVTDLNTVFATTARPRETRQPVRTPREASRVLFDDRASGLDIGLLFGAERAGLETTDIALCHGIVTIPIDPRHQSLNLAQAVAINAYEWRTLVLDAPPPNFREGDPPASGELQLGMYEHLEKELDAAGFFHPPEKFRSMSQNLRVMLGRAAFSAQEVATFRGVITALSKGRGRVLERLAREKAGKSVPSPLAGEGGSRSETDEGSR